MAKEFLLEILSPGRELLRAEVTEVVLPGYDGEVGILAGHEDFIGILGTGAVKIVRDGDDYWFMVSHGIYQVTDGSVTLFAELAERAEDVDTADAQATIAELEQVFSSPEKFSPEHFEEQRLRYDRSRARLEVHRRTELMQ